MSGPSGTVPAEHLQAQMREVVKITYDRSNGDLTLWCPSKDSSELLVVGEVMCCVGFNIVPEHITQMMEWCTGHLFNKSRSSTADDEVVCLRDDFDE